MKKRISLSELDATRIYEWWLAFVQLHGKCCEHCELTAKKLRKFLGEKHHRWITRLIKRNPYHRLYERKTKYI